MEIRMLKDALTIIKERKSVRTYTGEVVNKEDIAKILYAAMAAPAAVHMLPWKFIVVTNKATLQTLADGLPFAKMLTSAGTAIVVCAVPQEAAMGSEAFAILDCTCASENILLAAEALGLGAVWTAVYPNAALMNFIRKQLEVPQYVIPLNVIPVGYPTGAEKPQVKYDEKNIHWEKWQLKYQALYKINNMHFEINDTTPFKEIQKTFSDFYPFLQLEFYTRGHQKYEDSLDIDLVYPGTTVGDVKKTHVSGLLEILPLYKVADVEKEFQERFGLPVQVFWNDNNVWRATTDMDDFTLKELNEMGRNSFDDFIVEDYEEGFEENRE
jgi:nitroreductase